MPVMSAFGLRRSRRPVNVWGMDSAYDGGVSWYPNKPDYSGEFTGFHPARETEKMKKFYVGAKHIGASVQHGSNADCTRETLDEAINDAKQQIRDGAQCVVVVKIVAIVRRDSPPITVETID